jgi:hypothetical protein
MAAFPSREAALAALRELEALGHKQTYWVVGPDEPDP